MLNIWKMIIEGLIRNFCYDLKVNAPDVYYEYWVFMDCERWLSDG